MSPDPYSGSYDFTNPQSLNRYTYVQNNPAWFTDPSGKSIQGIPTLGACVGGPEVCGMAIAVDVAAIAIGGLVIKGLEDLFGPSFHGSLKPRPSAASWDGNFGESLGVPTSIPQGNMGLATALGLPSEGCEFGACGTGPTNFSAGTVALGGGAAEGICVVVEPCAIAGGIIIGGVLLYENREAVQDSWTALADKFLKNYNNLQNENNDRCSVVKQAAIQSCSAQFIGQGNNESPALTRACVRVKMAAQGCFNF
jgi:hypothetical protein